MSHRENDNVNTVFRFRGRAAFPPSALPRNGRRSASPRNRGSDPPRRNCRSARVGAPARPGPAHRVSTGEILRLNLAETLHLDVGDYRRQIGLGQQRAEQAGPIRADRIDDRDANRSADAERLRMPFPSRRRPGRKIVVSSAPGLSADRSCPARSRSGPVSARRKSARPGPLCRRRPIGRTLSRPPLPERRRRLPMIERAQDAADRD